VTERRWKANSLLAVARRIGRKELKIPVTVYDRLSYKNRCHTSELHRGRWNEVVKDDTSQKRRYLRRLISHSALRTPNTFDSLYGHRTAPKACFTILSCDQPRSKYADLHRYRGHGLRRIVIATTNNGARIFCTICTLCYVNLCTAIKDIVTTARSDERFSLWHAFVNSTA